MLAQAETVAITATIVIEMVLVVFEVIKMPFSSDMQ